MRLIWRTQKMSSSWLFLELLSMRNYICVDNGEICWHSFFSNRLYMNSELVTPRNYCFCFPSLSTLDTLAVCTDHTGTGPSTEGSLAKAHRGGPIVKFTSCGPHRDRWEIEKSMQWLTYNFYLFIFLICQFWPGSTVCSMNLLLLRVHTSIPLSVLLWSGLPRAFTLCG